MAAGKQHRRFSPGRDSLMSLYIKTEDYRKHGISKYSDLALIRAVVQEELKMERVFVSFVNRHEYIRVDFLSPRPPRRQRKRGARRGAPELEKA